MLSFNYFLFPEIPVYKMVEVNENSFKVMYLVAQEAAIKSGVIIRQQNHLSIYFRMT